jgi:hypothetical protein
LFVMDHDEISNIPKDRTVTYWRIVIELQVAIWLLIILEKLQRGQQIWLQP